MSRIAAIKEALCKAAGAADYDGELFSDALDLAVEVQRLEGLLNAPEVRDFVKGVTLEAAHQRARWGTSHDDDKAPSDWFWLVGYLAGKALHAHVAGNAGKALHHTISTAAALCNWHAAILGKTDMRPGIATPAGESEAAQ